jgi:hypothetical protein
MLIPWLDRGETFLDIPGDFPANGAVVDLAGVQ